MVTTGNGASCRLNDSTRAQVIEFHSISLVGHGQSQAFIVHFSFLHLALFERVGVVRFVNDV